MSRRHFTAAPGDTLRLRTNFFLSVNGVATLTDPLSFIADVGIYLVGTGGTAIQTLTPVKESDGVFFVDVVLPNDFASVVLYDEWAWVGTTGAPNAVQRYLSDIELTEIPTPPGTDFVESPTAAIGHIWSTVTKTQKTPPKSGYTVKPAPRSVRESISQMAHDRLKTITKSAIEGYIRSFLDTTGDNRAVIEAISKGSLQYITDKSLKATDDLTIRATQLVRIFNEVRERTPAIVIMDAGYTPIPSGLFSGLTHSTLCEGKWQGYFNKQAQIPLSIAILTNDQDSTDQLMEVVMLQFDNLRELAGGSLICSEKPEDHWVVRLPLTQNVSGTEGVNITEDSKDQLWFANIDVTVDAEDTFAIELPFDTSLTSSDYDGDFSGGISPQFGTTGGLVLPPQIFAPDTIQINTPVAVVFKRLRHSHKITIDQPMIATIDVAGRTITPRRLGTFNLQILDLDSRKDESGPRALAPVVAAQKSITVTL